LVHGLQQERHVVEVEVLNAAAAQLEELLAHEVDAGEDHGVDRTL